MTPKYPITITDKAVEFVKTIMAENGKNPEHDALRMYIQGGGCSGFQYGLMFNEETTGGDLVFESGGIKIIVDPISINYVKGAVIDLIEQTESTPNSGLTIINPNAKSTCGCGQSFNTDTDENGDDHCHS